MHFLQVFVFVMVAIFFFELAFLFMAITNVHCMPQPQISLYTLIVNNNLHIISAEWNDPGDFLLILIFAAIALLWFGWRKCLFV